MGYVENAIRLLQCNCCHGNMFVCGAVTYDQLLSSFLFHSHCLAIVQHAALWMCFEHTFVSETFVVSAN
jgi:hypothetical protein